MTYRAFSFMLSIGFFLLLSSCQTTPVVVTTDLQPELEQTKKTLANREEELFRAQASIADFEASVADLKAKLASLEAELNQMSKGNSQVTQTRDELERERSALRARTAELEALVAGLNARLAEASNNISKLNETNASLRVTSDLMSKSLTDSKEAQQNKIADLVRQNEALMLQIAELTKANDTLGMALNEQSRRLAETVEQLKRQLKVEIERGDLDVLQYRDVIIVNIKDSVGFQPDSAVLRPEFEPVLRKIAEAFAKFPDKVIRVEGHTAVAPSRWSNSWDLGTSRAVSVVRFLQERVGVEPTRLVALSFGEYRPLAPNTSEENRSKNRRVEIVLVERPLYQVQELIQSGK